MVFFENLDSKTDEELVSLVLENQDYFLHLMNRYAKRLLGYIIRLSGLKLDDAEDVLQEVFIKVYRHLNSFDQSQKFSSWIYSITRHQVISNFRKTKSRPQLAAWDSDDEFLKNIASDFNLESELDNHLNQEAIYKILDRLDYKYKEVLALKFFEGKDYREIADIIQKPMGTVATLINRAKKKFREEFSARGGSAPGGKNSNLKL